ncbi:MAG TPA: GNAT family protein [Pseudonocardiaceae bacterium]|jgi:RimJ/RimL family protein N-acetyltransferase|nr:GNAT family protein [Pseudonocardiaceae bacterium]
MFPIRLNGSQVILREFCLGDLDRIMTVVGDDRVTKTLSFDTRSREQATEMLNGVITRARQEPRTEYYFAVDCVDAGLVGFARLGLNGVQAAKLGGATAADYWGRGYATDAVRTLVDFGFRELKLHRISAAIGPENAASIAIVRRLGMMYEGRIRDHVYTNGQWRDSLLYSVLADEW